MATPFAPGAHIGEARIVRAIGTGSVATVYEAQWRGRRCALKIVDGTVDAPSVAERVAQEGEAISMIEHVNVVRWFQSGIHDGRVWLLLELVEGKNLREVVRAAGGKLDVERAVGLARHACEGLAAVHKKGIVHRDVTPENILVTGDDVAKIADFGSAKLPGWGVKTTNTLRLTSKRYTAPELWRAGATATPAADVYAMGVILYEIVAGAHPIAPEGADALTLLDRFLHHDPPPLSSAAEEVTGELSDLVQRAMVRDPSVRCTARELADGLEMAQDRLLAWRRTAARSVPLPGRHVSLQRTVQMSSAAPQAGPQAAVRGSSGTMLMEAVPASGGGRGPELAASPPTAPSTDASTLRVLSRPPADTQGDAQPHDRARGSTGIAVEGSAHAAASKPRRLAVIVAALGSLLVLGALSAWWALSADGTAPTKPPPPASASTSPPAPKPPASAPRPPARPPAHPRR